jgi:membrane fusion protein (multidrug efflux system)
MPLFRPTSISVLPGARLHTLRASASAFSSGSRLAFLGAVFALAACGQGDPAKGAKGGAPGGMPAPEVGVLTVQPGDVGLQTELPGRLEASRVAQVRARAAGILQQRLFQEGSDVKAGQTLFRIDPAPYEAALQTAEAQLARSEANLAQTRALAERYQPLAAAQAVSQQEYANAVAAQKQAEADVAAGRAAVRNARINLGHATVTAPIAGRIGRALVTEGALVGQGEATQLALVQQVDPLYVNFTQSASEALRLRRALEAGQLKAAGKGAAEVRVVLDDGSEHPQAGKLLFTDLTVDPATGQVSLRAELPNPGGRLLPGLYVRVRLEQARASNAITLPQQAVMRSAQGDAVQVVTPEGKIEQRRIQVGGQQGGRWVVLDGLKAGEQVMVDGFQKVQMLPPGTPVKAVPWQPAGAAPAAAPAASAASGAASPASR